MSEKRGQKKKPKNRPITKRPAAYFLSSEHQAKVEREKRLAMYAGVGFFMVVIAVVWVINFKNNIQPASRQAVSPNTQLDAAALNFKEVITEAKKNMADLKQAMNNSGQVAAIKLPTDMERRIELEKLLFSLNDKLTQASSTGENQ